MASGTPTASHRSPPRHHAQPSLGANPASPPSKRDLKSWWKGFKLAPKQHQEAQELSPKGIFGVPLRESITYANVAISLMDENGKSYIYGYVPIVVAKCGVYLKEKATTVEGIFRLNGSEKRIKELKQMFDSPDRYGKGLVWEGYTVHDAANVLRRYLNDLPEPVVPLDLYAKFREPLKGATRQAVGDAEGAQFVEHFDEQAAIHKYQTLITELPPLNRQLLLYILDLLAVFAAKSDENRMNSQNLAAIFQPGMLSHPQHAMAPEEYRLNQCVIIFLIENQDHFLIGMQGTAADEQTMKAVQSGTPVAGTGSPGQKRTADLGRSASNASAGAESVRRDGKLRRNRSVSSRNSATRHDSGSTPGSPALATTPTGGLGRSNTVPSKKSPALVGGKFKKPAEGGSHSPGTVEPMTPVRPIQEVEQPEVDVSPSANREAPTATSSVLPQGGVSSRGQEGLLEVPQGSATNTTAASSTPSKERNLTSFFQKSSAAEPGEKRQPNKLRKKRIPGSLNASAQSSSASLGYSHPGAVSPGFEVVNPMDAQHAKEAPTSMPREEPTSVPHPHSNTQDDTTATQQPSATTVHMTEQPQTETKPTEPSDLRRFTEETAPNIAGTLQPALLTRAKSPAASSIHSSHNDAVHEAGTVPEHADASQGSPEKDKKRRWRLSRSNKHDSEGPPPHNLSAREALHPNENAIISDTSVNSSSNLPRKSFTGDSSQDPGHAGSTSTDHDGKDGKDESRGPMHWIKNKYREARNKSPTGDKERSSSSHGQRQQPPPPQQDSSSVGTQQQQQSEAQPQPSSSQATPAQQPQQQAEQSTASGTEQKEMQSALHATAAQANAAAPVIAQSPAGAP